MEVQIQNLVTKIANLKSRVLLIDQFLTNASEYPPYCEVKSRVPTYQNISSAYEKIWEEFSGLNISVDDNLSVEFKKSVSEFDEISQKVNADMIYLIDRYETDIKNEEKLKPTEPQWYQKNPIIPPLTVTPFDGTPTQWLSFKECCEAVFHKNPNIEDIHKFAYLKKVLRGDALAKIQGIHLTAAGYHKAWNELCAYYDGTRTVIEHHIDALLNIKPISKDTYDEVNTLLNTCIVNVTSLEAHGYVVEKLSEVMLVYAISKKFSVSMKKEWEKSLEESELASFQSTDAEILVNTVGST